MNENIRAPKLRLIDDEGNQLGVLSREDALDLAAEKELDLVCVAPGASPPVCRLMQWSKFRLRQQKKEKEQLAAKRKEVSKDLRLHPSIAEHDYEVKKQQALRWLQSRYRVRVVVVMRGREQSHPELAAELLDRLINELAEFAQASVPSRQGREMSCQLTAKK
jgi:translation initiation factor IF-3